MRTSISPRRRRRRTGAFPFLLVFALATMLLGPIADQAALAQADTQQDTSQNQTEAPPTEVPAEPEATEVPPEVVPTEEAVATEEIVATEVPTEAAAPESVTLTITVYRCDHPEFDTGFSENLQTVIDTCTGPGSGTFTITDGVTDQTGSGGSLSFEIVGNLYLQESVPAGYDNPIANCFLYNADGSLGDQIGPGETSGGAWKVGGIRDGDVHCDWYQVDRGLGTVYVVNMACPSTAGLFPEPSMTDLVSVCTEPAGQKQFFVVHGAGLERMVPSGGEFNDALFEAIQTGPIEIWMDDPAGFDKARVFCQVTTLDGAEISPFAEVSVGNFRASGLTLVAGQRIHCSWFNIQEGPGLTQDDGGTTATEVPTTGTSEFRVEKHTCPAGYDPEAAGADPDADCPVGPDGVAFSLADADPNTADMTSTTGDAGSGLAAFTGLVPGDYTVTETVPAGTGTIFVLGCGGGGGVDPIPTFIDGTLEVGVPQGVIMTCPWFNIAADGEVSSPEATSDETASPEASPGVVTRALEGTGSITIAKYNCPAGFDVTTIDANPQASCTPAEGISFDIDDSVDDNSGYSIETGADGMGTVNQLPADTYFIDEGVRNGTTATFVWDCYDAAGSSTRTDPLKIGSSLTYELSDGAAIRCDFYNVIGGTSRVVINKHGCDYLVPAYTLTVDQLRTQCTIDTGKINFTVVSDTHQETQPASNNPLTLASFADVPSGYISVVEDLPGGWAIPIVSCQLFDENGLPLADPEFLDVVVGRQVSFALEAGQVMGCDWFNVAQGFVDVQVTKYACPEGYDPYGADLTTLVVDCTDDPGSVEIVTGDGRLYLESRTATAGVPASFTDVPSGQLRVEEKLPEGYGIPVVWCRVDFEDGSNVIPAEPVTITNGSNTGYLSFYHDASAGQSLACEWFNVKGSAGMVSILKQACPVDFDIYEASRLELESGCTDDFGTVDFSVTSGSFTDTASSTNLFPYADFYAVPSGKVTVTETSVTSYPTAIVYCHVQEDGKPTTADELVDVSTNFTINWDLGPNQWLICEWYNAHVPEGTVDVTKWTCPEGLEPGTERSYYEEKCTETLDGVEFTVTGIASSSTQATANGGKAHWTDILPGLVTVAEQIPEGYGQPVVFCTAPKVNSNFPVSNGTIEYELFEGGYLDCDWFNIPYEGSTIVIHKYTCEEGSPHDEDASWYAENCTEAHAGIDFTLTAGMGASTLPTDAKGEVEWTGVPLGSFSIQETIPYEYGEPVVFCGIVSSSGGPIDAVAKPVEAPNGYHTGEIAYPKTLYVCYWFNIYDGPGDLTIYKYTCPAGYDLHAWDANPREDCPDATNGIAFTLGGPATEFTATTGDDIDGAAFFDEIDPGSYTVTESVPEGIQYVFVLDCYGQDRGSLRPYPLALGDTLDIQVGSGESITCYWYNVPGYDPGTGRITVTKYLCSTKTYVSDVDCEIYEDGAAFDLVFWDGDSWEFADTKTTDGGGMIAWTNVDPGQYWLDEHDGDWCEISSPQLSDDGNWIGVSEDEETTIAVYNCGGTPGKPGKTPMKYPNTGVPPGDHRRDLP